MRPTIDEQLAGALRLLRFAEAEKDTTPGVADLIRNARRLVERAAGSWASALPFLREDNRRLAALLDVEPGEAAELADAAARNEELRGLLSQRIHAVPRGPLRAEIGAMLRERVAVDPT